MSDEELALTAIVDRMASAQPTPAGGAAAAISIAHGAALLCKAVRVGTRRDPSPPELADRLESLARRATDFFRADCAAFEAVLSARRQSDPPRLDAAWAHATRVPLDLAALATEALSEVAPAREHAPRSMEADIEAARRLLEVGLAISLENARANVGFVRGAERSDLDAALVEATNSAPASDRRAAAIARATREACGRAAASAAVDGGVAGLCVEGRLDLVVDAVRSVSIESIVEASGSGGLPDD